MAPNFARHLYTLALLISCSLQCSQTGTRLSARFKIPIICASLNHLFLIVSLLRYLAKKILFLNTTNFRWDFPPKTL
jgi:hypothetical protein